MKSKLYIQDVTLRDGMHAIGHDYDVDQIKDIVAALDDAGVDAIEVAHGDGLSGSSFTFGFGRCTDIEWIRAAASACKRARLTTLLIPGIGTRDDLCRAFDAGVKSVRIATHCTEADVAAQHIEAACRLGMDVSGFLMMSHIVSPEDLADQAKIMENSGAHCVYVTDSCGSMRMSDVRDRVRAYRKVLRPETQVGIHAHQNLSLAVANSIAAIEEGAVRVDASLAGSGAGAGNTPLEAFIAAIDGMEFQHDCDLFMLMDAAEELARPLQRRAVRVDRETISLGYAGVYSSFLLHAERAAKEFGLDTRQILIELGNRKVIGGQEDMILDVALDLVERKRAENDSQVFVEAR